MRAAKNFECALVAAVLLALAATSCATRGGVTPARTDGGDETRTFFERNCAVCHGPRGEGKQLGTLNVPSLRVGRPSTDPDERLFTQIRDGGKGMPPFKYTLNDEQIQALVRFVREELQGRGK